MGEVRKWSSRDITIKLKNLTRIIPYNEIEREIKYAHHYTNDVTDAMNIAYYALKRKHSKIIMGNFGLIRQVEYKPKPSNRFYGYYIPYSYTWSSSSNGYYIPSSYTWSPSSNGTSTYFMY